SAAGGPSSIRACSLPPPRESLVDGSGYSESRTRAAITKGARGRRVKTGACSPKKEPRRRGRPSGATGVSGRRIERDDLCQNRARDGVAKNGLATPRCAVRQAQDV